MAKQTVTKGIEKTTSIKKEEKFIKIPAIDELRQGCSVRAMELYGKKFPEIVEARMDRELDMIDEQGTADFYLSARELSISARKQTIPLCFRGPITGSLVSFLAQIAYINPLPPHYYCPNCNSSDFPRNLQKSLHCGLDLPDRVCPVCGKPMRKDGYDLPVEIAFGARGEHMPVLSLETIPDFFTKAMPEGYEKEYDEFAILDSDVIEGDEEADRYFTEKEESLLLDQMEDNLYHSIGCTEPNMRKVHIVKKGEKNELVRILCVLSPNLEFLYSLMKVTHIDPRFAFFGDPKTFGLFKGSDSVGLPKDVLGYSYGTLGVPIYSSPKLESLLNNVTLNRFSDLIRMTGLFLGTGTWIENGDYLLREKIASYDDLIASRDDLFECLMRHEYTAEHAIDVCKVVWNGHHLTEAMEQEMEMRGIPDFAIESIKCIRTLYSRAQIIYQNGVAWQAAWYKTYYPREFYRAFFEVFATEEQMQNIRRGRQYIEALLDETDPDTLKDLGKPSRPEYRIYLTAREMYLRNYTLM